MENNIDTDRDNEQGDRGKARSPSGLCSGPLDHILLGVLIIPAVLRHIGRMSLRLLIGSAAIGAVHILQPDLSSAVFTFHSSILRRQPQMLFSSKKQHLHPPTSSLKLLVVRICFKQAVSVSAPSANALRRYHLSGFSIRISGWFRTNSSQAL